MDLAGVAAIFHVFQLVTVNPRENRRCKESWQPPTEPRGAPSLGRESGRGVGVCGAPDGSVAAGRLWRAGYGGQVNGSLTISPEHLSYRGARGAMPGPSIRIGKTANHRREKQTMKRIVKCKAERGAGKENRRGWQIFTILWHGCAFRCLEGLLTHW